MTDQHGENPTEPTGEGTGASENAATPPPTPPPPADVPPAGAVPPADAPPPAGAVPPADAPPPAAPAAPAGSASSFDAKATLQGAHKYDLGIVAAGVVAFLASFLPFYTISVKVTGIGSGSDSASAWHAFFGWFGILLALAGAIVVALELFNAGQLPVPVHQIATGLFGLATLCLILALFIDPGGCGGASAFGVNCSIGRGFGYWLALLATLVGLGLSVMRMRESRAKTA